ncbi:MAG: hypothetical protein CVT96_07640 [Bacteroidetes bacterium HGW-Bacteroidetes-13]|nr:MAG: hypothetical protein CVT96_07640 [Bacteroidetes bacterium HGW-Bacteroidetes-13]
MKRAFYIVIFFLIYILISYFKEENDFSFRYYVLSGFTFVYLISSIFIMHLIFDSKIFHFKNQILSYTLKIILCLLSIFISLSVIFMFLSNEDLKIVNVNLIVPFILFYLIYFAVRFFKITPR